MYANRYSVESIVEFIRSKTKTTNANLQIMLYMLWCMYWNIFKESLFEPEFRLAKFGPYIPWLYRHYQVYGGYAIEFDLPIEQGLIAQIDPTDKALLESLIEKLGKDSWYCFQLAPKLSGSRMVESNRVDLLYRKIPKWCRMKDSEQIFELLRKEG